MARRRSKRIIDINEPYENERVLFDESEGSSNLNPYHDVQQSLNELSREEEQNGTDDEFVITQDDEDGKAGFRHRTRRSSTSPKKRKRSRSQSNLVDKDNETTDVFWNFYNQINELFDAYKYILCTGILIAIIGILFTIAVLLIYSNPKASKPDPVKFDAFKKNVHQLFQTPNQRNLLNIMYYVGRRLTRLDDSTDPIFILVAASHEENLRSFITNFEILLNDTKQIEVFELDTTTSRIELNSNVERILDNNKYPVLHRIDLLRGDGPQVLHAMSDLETSPHKNSLFVGTLKLPKPLEKPNDCIYDVQSYLEEEWISEKLPSNQFSAVLSRITSFTICID